jgi:serine/threonine protein kinase/tetratricopeptide (TPR) repeat protein
VTTARVQSVKRPPSHAPSESVRTDPRTSNLSTAAQVGEFLVTYEFIHENRWQEAVSRIGVNNLHLILAEIAAPPETEDDFSSTHLLRERRLTRFQIDQILAGQLNSLVLGPFLIRRRLGRGGMAEVFQAYNRELDRIEAVKVLRNDRQRTQIDLAALARREARVLASLVHPNITTIFRAGAAGQLTYLAMEYVPGETADAKISRFAKEGRQMPVREAVRIAAEAAQALAYAHTRHVVHRDIKPGNIMVAPDGRVKVLDLGIAALFAADKEESFGKGAPQGFSSLAGFGTPHYMAPEQWRENETTEAVDIYGLGATLFHLLIGRPPIVEKDLEVLLARKEEGVVNPHQLRREVPKSLGRIVQKAMAGDPAKRFASMDAFALALEQYVGPDSGAVRTYIPWMGVAAVLAISAFSLRFDPSRQAASASEADSGGQSQLAAVKPATAEPPKQIVYQGASFATAGDAARHAEAAGDLESAAKLYLEAAKGESETLGPAKRKAHELLETLVGKKMEADPKKAVEAATWAAGLAPESWRLAELHGVAEMRLERFDDAVVQFDLAATKAPMEAGRLNGLAASAIRKIAEKHVRNGRFKQADEALAKAVDKYPSQSADLNALRRESLIQWSNAAVKSGDANAAEVVAAARALMSDRPEALKLSAESHERSKNWKAAAEEWTAWGAAANDLKQGAARAASCWKQWAKDALAAGDHRSAVDRLERSRQLAGTDAEIPALLVDASNQLGLSLQKKGDDAGALEQFNRSLRFDPKSAATFRTRGLANQQLKNYDAAEKDFSEAVKLDGANAAAFRMRGALRLLHKPQKDWKDIMSDLQQAVRIDADDAGANYHLAYVYAYCPDKSYRSGAKAVHHAAKACKATNEENWEHLAMLAAAHAELGQFDEAIKRVEQAERRAPEKNKAELRALAEHYRKQ